MTNERAARLGAALRAAGLRCAVLTDYDAVAYATDLDVFIEIGMPFVAGGPDLAVVSDDGATTLVVADTCRAAAESSHADEVVVYEASHDGAVDAYRSAVGGVFARSCARGPIGVQPTTLPASVATLLPRTTRDVTPVLRQVRMIKSEQELERLRRCADLTSAAQRRAARVVRAGVTELAAFAEIRLVWESGVGGRAAVTGDFISGVSRTAGVLGLPNDRVMREGDPVIVDLAPRLNGYWGDSANTLFIGEPGDEFRRMHATVKNALTHGAERIRPGMTAGAADELIRGVVRDGGYDYPHHTGHSVGTASHEFPCIRPEASTPLVEGMVILLEPGAYRPDLGGVRLEWMFEVTATGLTPMSSFDHVLAPA